MKLKRGDTLIEVALAIGVFSLIAITVVAVVSSSLTNAQAALEVTLTREELDARAEALRFIHESYISGSQSNIKYSDNPYEKLWETIRKHATTIDNATQEQNIERYNPATCADVYNTDGTLKRLKSNLVPFVIDIRQLGVLTDANINNIIVDAPADPSGNKFGPASTFSYPRILYNTSNTSMDAQAQNNVAKIAKVEGIYIIAVAGKDNKIVVGNTVDNSNNKISYYDFYIRSCWMPLNSDRASTISTVVRLYDPAVITY